MSKKDTSTGSWNTKPITSNLITTQNYMPHSHTLTVEDALPIGVVLDYIGSDIPTNYLNCNDTIVDSSLYPELYKKVTSVPLIQQNNTSIKCICKAK